MTWFVLGLALVGWIGTALFMHRRGVAASRTASNLLSALREGDTSLRGALSKTAGARAELIREINGLADSMHAQRIRIEESAALLSRVMAEIDVAILAFDRAMTVKLANRAAIKLLGISGDALSGMSARKLGIEELLTGDVPRTVDLALPGGRGQFELKRSVFRELGLPHTLVVLSGLERALREEERRAWQKLVRVLGHEINNSLAPIQSLAASLSAALEKIPRPGDLDEDLSRGLSVISRRAESLGRFMTSYAKLARLPEPSLETVNIADCVRRAAALESRKEVAVQAGPEVEIRADRAQLEQALINLVCNAVEATASTGGAVAITWRKSATEVEITVLDEGPGLPDTANLFVPFFTTKPDGSGIGLALTRQIAEAHGGSLTLENRPDRPGCIAALHLPRQGSKPAT